MRKFLLFASFMVVTCISALAQSLTITGTVTGEDGLPIPGAAVMVKGTTAGTVTDMDGNYRLNVPAEAESLIFRFVGMADQEQPINGRTVINAAMESDWEEIDEVVVVAYGSAKRGSLTGAVSRVGSEQIEQTIGTSVTGALEGQAPGVQVNNTYGEPGAAPTIRIRGIGSVNGSNNPLIVLDGVPYNGSIADINSNDIESMTVLKDASSAALYGSRAANGVILINTKGAAGGKSVVTFTANMGLFTRGIKEYDRLGADDWMEVQWRGMRNMAMTSAMRYNAENAAVYATKNIIKSLVKRNIYNAADDKLFDANGKLVATVLPGYDDLDWVKAVEQTGHRQEYGMSYQSNNEKYTLFASFDYLNEEGYIINTGYKRFSGRVNSTITPKKWAKLGINVAGAQAKRNYNDSAEGTYYANPFYQTRMMAPIYPIYLHNADGSYVLDKDGQKQYDTTSDYLGNRHIIYERKTDKQEAERYNLDGTVFATAYLPLGFDVTVKANENIVKTSATRFNNSSIGDGAANGGRYTDTESRTQTVNFQQLINWSHDFDIHHVDALGAHESYKYSYRYVSGMNTKQSVEGLTEMSNFAINSYLEGYSEEETTESYLGRVRYNYAEKYFADASFRTDGSSRFDENNRWGQFFSVGAAWDITREDFMEKNDYVNFLKLRASFGQVGNNLVLNGTDQNYYASKPLYALDKNAGSAALFIQQLDASKVKWETTQTIDIALEARLFSRLNVNLGYFDKTSKDLLFNVPLPASAGSNIHNQNTSNITLLKNIGRVKNNGWEISADVDVLQGDVKWNVGADVTLIKNKIKELPDGEDIANGSLRLYSEGHSMYEFYTYHFIGVDQLTGRSLYELDEDMKAAANYYGELVTINGVDYTTDITYGKRNWRGSAMPKAYGSVHTNVSWKGLTFNVLATYQLGGKVFDSGYSNLMQTSASSVSALHKDILKAWNGAPEGMTETSANRIDKNGIPVIDHNLSEYNNDAYSDRWLVSANYFVVKNIGLTYALPNTIVNKLDLESISFNAGVENAFTFTARQGLNPQYDFSGAQDATYTTARLFNVGVTVKF